MKVQVFDKLSSVAKTTASVFILCSTACLALDRIPGLKVLEQHLYSTSSQKLAYISEEDFDWEEEIKDENELVDPASLVKLMKRSQKIATVSLDSEYAYMFNITVGGQKFLINLDTLTSDTWLFNASVSPCPDSFNGSMQNICSLGGRFNGSESNTFLNLNADFNSTELDGGSATGTWGMDTLIAGDATIKNFTFGLVNSTTESYGGGSVGMLTRASWGQSSFVQALVDTGDIYSPTVALALNNASSEDSSGSAMFGAIDTERFQPPLGLMPMNPIEGYPEGSNIFIQLSQIGVEGPSGSANATDELDLPVLIDSTDPFSYLPYDIIVQLALQINAYYVDSLSAWVQSCKFQDEIDGTFNFRFHDVVIKVPVSAIFFGLSKADGSIQTFSNGDEVCVLAFASSEVLGFNTIGTSILSSMYTVLDLAENQVGIAQANLKPKSSDVQVVSSNLTSLSQVSLITPAVLNTATVNTEESNFTATNSVNPKVIISNGEFVTTGTPQSVLPTDLNGGARSTTTMSPGPVAAAPRVSLPTLPILGDTFASTYLTLCMVVFITLLSV